MTEFDDYGNEYDNNMFEKFSRHLFPYNLIDWRTLYVSFSRRTEYISDVRFRYIIWSRVAVTNFQNVVILYCFFRARKSEIFPRRSADRRRSVGRPLLQTVWYNNVYDVRAIKPVFVPHNPMTDGDGR